MPDLTLIHLQQDAQQQGQMVALLEEALARAKAGDTRYLVIAYAVRGQDSPVMAWRGTTTPRDLADAVLGCELLKQAIIAKNVKVT